jgi:hypothetical protein
VFVCVLARELNIELCFVGNSFFHNYAQRYIMLEDSLGSSEIGQTGTLYPDALIWTSRTNVYPLSSTVHPCDLRSCIDLFNTSQCSILCILLLKLDNFIYDEGIYDILGNVKNWIWILSHFVILVHAKLSMTRNVYVLSRPLRIVILTYMHWCFATFLY